MVGLNSVEVGGEHLREEGQELFDCEGSHGVGVFDEYMQDGDDVGRGRIAWLG